MANTNKNETVEQVCEIVHREINNYIGSLGYGLLVLMKTNDFINRTLAAHNREIRERDAEIIAKAIIIDAKDALICELTDALKDAKGEFEIRKNNEFDDDEVIEYCDKNIARIDALVEKAKEILEVKR